MFAKLLKHEWRAVSGVMSILSLAALGAAALSAIILRLMIAYGEKAPALQATGGILLFGAILALVAYVVGSLIFLLFRFYKNKFTDEGYLTFTLPVTTHQILLSSLLVMVAWSVITFAVVFFGLVMVLLIGTTTDSFINMEVLRGIGTIAGEIGKVMAGQTSAQAISILTVVNFIVSALASLVLMVTSITIGSIAAKKHKVLAAVATYYLINMGTNMLTSLISIPVMVSAADAASLSEAMSSTIVLLVIQIVLYLALTVGGYFVSAHMMKKKLDLP